MKDFKDGAEHVIITNTKIGREDLDGDFLVINNPWNFSERFLVNETL